MNEDNFKGKYGRVQFPYAGSVSESPDPGRLEHDLQERIKELNCLYGIAQLAEKHPISIEKFLSDVVALLPSAWQFPETTCARITFRDAVYLGADFVETEWRQTAPVRDANVPVGEITICYRETRPPSYEGPFLLEERVLINGVAEYLGMVTGRIETDSKLLKANQLLTVEREALKELNTSLRTVLARIDEDKRALGRDIQANVEKIILPILHALELELPPPKRSFIDLLRGNLLEITTPFTSRLATTYASLTPAEIAVCNMIRNGLRTKEIARLRGIAPATVSRHREHIRRKLGLANRRLNLISFLQNAGGETERRT